MWALWAAIHSGCNCIQPYLNRCQVSLFNLLLLCLSWCILLQEPYLSATHPCHKGSKANQNKTRDVFLVRKSQAVALISHVPCLHSNCYYVHPPPPGGQVRLLSDTPDLHKTVDALKIRHQIVKNQSDFKTWLFYTEMYLVLHISKELIGRFNQGPNLPTKTSWRLPTHVTRNSRKGPQNDIKQ